MPNQFRPMRKRKRRKGWQPDPEIQEILRENEDRYEYRFDDSGKVVGLQFQQRSAEGSLSREDLE